MKDTLAIKYIHALSCLLIMQWGGFLYSTAQIVSIDTHYPCITDSAVPYVIPYQNRTDSGTQCVWDFSKNDLTEKKQQYLYDQQSELDMTQFTRHWLRGRYKYQIIGDTLYCLGAENSNMSMTYSEKEKVLVFPFHYADTIGGTFRGYGEYAHSDTFSIQGHTITIGDAIGKIRLPDGITKDSVLRVHTRRTYQQINKERMNTRWDIYQWYAADYRYPIMETARCENIRMNDTTEWTMAVYFPLEQYEDIALSKSVNTDTILLKDNEKLAPIDTYPNPIKDILYLTYTLAKNAKVYYSLHYNGGGCMYKSAEIQQEAGTYTIAIGMNDYPTGMYVLYIYADDDVVSKNIMKL